MDEKRKEKLAVFCSVRHEDVISAPDVESIYDVPVNFEKDHLSDILLKKLGLKAKRTQDLGEWEKKVRRIKNMEETVKIGVVGKYFKTGDFVLSDAYISVIEAIKHAACEVGRRVELTWIASTDFEEDAKIADTKKVDIIIPGGFGSRGIEGKIAVIRYCREHQIPYFGLCYGMQLAVIEYARNVVGLIGAHTTEVDQKSPYPVVDIMPEQKEIVSRTLRSPYSAKNTAAYELRVFWNVIASL
jgi:CTP synthase